MANITEHLDWSGLNTYTQDVKEWIFKLLRRIHARIGHVEEDLYNVRKSIKQYYIEKNTDQSGNIVYSLLDNSSKSSHGDIVISSEGVVVSTWEEDLNV